MISIIFFAVSVVLFAIVASIKAPPWEGGEA